MQERKKSKSYFRISPLLVGGLKKMNKSELFKEQLSGKHDVKDLTLRPPDGYPHVICNWCWYEKADSCQPEWKVVAQFNAHKLQSFGYQKYREVCSRYRNSYVKSIGHKLSVIEEEIQRSKGETK